MLKFVRGFTFVELMVVIGIIGILASIAMPVYNGYVVRSRVTEGILALSQCRQSVSEIYQFSNPGTTVGANGWACLEGMTQTQYVSVVNTDENGVATVTMRNLGDGLEGKTVQMVPTINGVDAVITQIPNHINGFRCAPGGADPLDRTYVPNSCR
jgi:type IV pilus assembly protein PilA